MRFDHRDTDVRVRALDRMPASFEVDPGGSRVLPGGVASLVLRPRQVGDIGVGEYIVDDGRAIASVE